MSVFNVLQESQRATAALRMLAAGAPLKRGGRAALESFGAAEPGSQHRYFQFLTIDHLIK